MKGVRALPNWPLQTDVLYTPMNGSAVSQTGRMKLQHIVYGQTVRVGRPPTGARR